MKKQTTLCGLAFFVLSLSAVSVHADTKMNLLNPGFEEELASWVASGDNNMSKPLAEAARNGKYGLRVTDQSPELGSSLYSSPLQAEPGKKYQLRYWAKAIEGAGGIGVYVLFYDAQNKALNTAEKKNLDISIPDNTVGVWKEYVLNVVAPDGAAFVKVWVHSFGKAVSVYDIDDVVLMRTE